MAAHDPLQPVESSTVQRLVSEVFRSLKDQTPRLCVAYETHKKDAASRGKFAGVTVAIVKRYSVSFLRDQCFSYIVD